MSYSLTDSQYYIHKVSSYSLVVWDSNYFNWLYCFGGRNPSRPFKLLLIFKTLLSESRSTIASTVALKSEDLFFHVLKVFHINFRFHFKNLLFHIICTFVLCNSLSLFSLVNSTAIPHGCEMDGHLLFLWEIPITATNQHLNFHICFLSTEYYIFIWTVNTILFLKGVHSYSSINCFEAPLTTCFCTWR